MLVLNSTARHMPLLHRHHTNGPGTPGSLMTIINHATSSQLYDYEDDFQIDSNYNIFRRRKKQMSAEVAEVTRP